MTNVEHRSAVHSWTLDVGCSMFNVRPSEGRRRSRHGEAGQSGQVLVEACVALALLVFVWITAGFATYMSTNHIRTAMAARHAAWLKGNGGDVDPKAIATNFFMLEEDAADLVKVVESNGMGSIAGLISGDNNNFGQKGRAYWVVVKYGITAENLTSTEKFPFTLMRTEVPLMPPSLIENLLRVESHCQWAEVGDTWTDRKKALKELWDTIVAEMGGAGKFIKSLF